GPGCGSEQRLRPERGQNGGAERGEKKDGGWRPGELDAGENRVGDVVKRGEGAEREKNAVCDQEDEEPREAPPVLEERSEGRQHQHHGAQVLTVEFERIASPVPLE